MIGKYWILDHDGNHVEADLLTWARWLENAGPDVRRIAWDERGDVRVSTVFLGSDHSFGIGNVPILYETMIFGGPHNEYQDRYATRAEALEGHAKALRIVDGLETVEA